MSARRFVVLHHTGVERPHFDLLFEWEPGERLTSFRCPAWPPRLDDRWDEIGDHRRAYLTYEGDVSGGRGHVRRVAEGKIAIEVLASDPPTVALTMSDGTRVAIANVVGETLVEWVVQSIDR